MAFKLSYSVSCIDANYLIQIQCIKKVILYEIKNTALPLIESLPKTKTRYTSYKIHGAHLVSVWEGWINVNIGICQTEPFCSLDIKESLI